MREVFRTVLVVYFYTAAVLVVTGLLSRSLLGREDDQSYITNGLWERCNKSKANSQHSRCFLFDWQNEVKDTVAADRVRSVLAFGTMAVIGAIFILISPFVFAVFTCGDVTLKVMTRLFLASVVFMGLTGSVTWIIFDVYFDDIIIDDFEWFKYGWGAYVFMAGVGMTSLVIPVVLCECFCSDTASVDPAPELTK